MNTFNAYYTRKHLDEDGNVELIFTVKNFADIEISKELEKGKFYRLKFAEAKSTRSIQQNKYLWSLLEEIAEADNGERYTSDDVWDCYIEALERANAKFEYFAIKREGINLLKPHFRAIKEVNTFITEKGVEMVQCKGFYGSSKMDMKEMAKLIDMVLDMASERGIVLKEFKYE